MERQKRARQKIIENETRLNETGIVSLFERLRQDKAVIYSPEPEYNSVIVTRRRFLGGLETKITREVVLDYTPAKVIVSGPVAELHFDFDRQNRRVSVIGAELADGDQLFIVGRERIRVGEDISLKEAVEKALADPQIRNRKISQTGNRF